MEINQFELLFNYRYNLLYSLTALITLYFVFVFYIENLSYTKVQNFILTTVFVILAILFGTRGEYVGTDTSNNIKYFTGRVIISDTSSLNDIGLYSLSKFVSKFSSNIDVFLTYAALLYLVPIWLAIRNLKLRNPLIFFLCLYSMFFFRTMGINIQKQGIAFAFFLCGLSYIFLNRKIIGFLLFSVAFLFHASIILPIGMFIVTYKIKKINFIYYVYVLATLLAFVNFNFNQLLSNIPVVNILAESRLDTYYNDVGNYKTGFRPEFWLFNSIFAFIGWFTLKNIKAFKIPFFENNYRLIFISYLGLSSFFFLMFSARFNDRFGVLSWVFIPLLLLPYTQIKLNLKYLNTTTIFLISVLLFIVFKFI